MTRIRNTGLVMLVALCASTSVFATGPSAARAVAEPAVETATGTATGTQSGTTSSTRGGTTVAPRTGSVSGGVDNAAVRAGDRAATSRGSTGMAAGTATSTVGSQSSAAGTQVSDGASGASAQFQRSARQAAPAVTTAVRNEAPRAARTRSARPAAQQAVPAANQADATESLIENRIANRLGSEAVRATQQAGNLRSVLLLQAFEVARVADQADREIAVRTIENSAAAAAKFGVSIMGNDTKGCMDKEANGSEVVHNYLSMVGNPEVSNAIRIATSRADVNRALVRSLSQAVHVTEAQAAERIDTLAKKCDWVAPAYAGN